MCGAFYDLDICLWVGPWWPSEHMYLSFSHPQTLEIEEKKKKDVFKREVSPNWQKTRRRCHVGQKPREIPERKKTQLILTEEIAASEMN